MLIYLLREQYSNYKFKIRLILEDIFKDIETPTY